MPEFKKETAVQSVLTSETEDSGVIYIYGRIGQKDWYGDGNIEELTDLGVVKAVEAFVKSGKKRINVRINSPGGSMMHGEAIINAVKSADVEAHVYIDGIAASMAALMFLSVPKERRHMARNSKLMIHASSSELYGNASSHRAAADMLDVFDSGAIAQLAVDTGMSEEEVRSAYYDGNDHWFTAEQSLAAGFISSVEDYEAENVPSDVEGKTQAEIISFYDAEQKTSALDRVQRFFGKVAAVVTPEPKPQPSPENSEDMTIEELKAALAEGKISRADIAAELTDAGYTVEAPKPAPTPAEVNASAVADAVKAAMSEMVTPLQETIKTLEAKVTELGKAPGDTPAVAVAVEDPNAAPPVLTDAEAALKAQNEALAKSVTDGTRLQFTE